MKSLIIVFLTITALLAGSILLSARGLVAAKSLAWAPGQENPLAQSLKNEIIIKLKPDINEERLASLNHSLGAKIIKRIDEIGLLLLKSDERISPADMIAAVAKAGLVDFAELNGLRKAARIPNDPKFFEQWNLNLIGAPAVWDMASGSKEVVVAVLDTGIDHNHSDLSANIYRNTGEIPSNGLDDDKNGYIDDYLGWNFVHGNNDVRDDDSSSHGTRVAGIVAAVTDNATGIASLSKKATIMPLKTLNKDGYGDDFAVAKAITYAADNGACVINISFGGDSYSEAIAKAVEYARRKDCLLVAVAGNGSSSNVLFPATNPYVVAVSATDSHDNFALYSNYGEAIDLAAPGGSSSNPIISTAKFNAYSYGAGTSLAAPHVSALAALIRAAYPNLKANDVERLMERTALDKGEVGWDRYFGFGRIDAARAMSSFFLIDDPHEPNDTFGTASAISGGRVRAKMAKHADDFDIYSFSVSSAPADISITLSNISNPETFQLKVYDSSKRLLADSYSEENKRRLNYQANFPGTYYLSLSVQKGAGSDESDYLLEITASGQALSYFDLPSYHWAYEDIGYLSSLMIISGYPDGTFRPAGQITRAEFASIICRAKGLGGTLGQVPIFSDVQPNHWAYADIRAAGAKGIISGYPDGTFRPDAPATRAEIAKMLAHASELPINTAPAPFADLSATHWAYSPIMTSRNAGLIHGYQDGTFRPESKASRSEVSAMIARLLRSQASL